MILRRRFVHVLAFVVTAGLGCILLNALSVRVLYHVHVPFSALVAWPALIWLAGIGALGAWVDRRILVRIDHAARETDAISRGLQEDGAVVSMDRDEFDLLTQGLHRIRRSLRMAVRLVGAANDAA